MKTKTDSAVKLPAWWFILPFYLTAWMVSFSLYSYVDGNGMMEAFGIDTAGASDFVMLNSAGRYLALAGAMIVGIWIFRSYYSILTALLARLIMDVFDLSAGLQSAVISDATAVVQSFLMFLLPNAISIWLLIRYRRKQLVD